MKCGSRSLMPKTMAGSAPAICELPKRKWISLLVTQPAWDWSVGATHVADNLPATPEAVIVLDMIGDADQNIYYEHNSDKPIQQQLWKIAAGHLGFSKWFIPQERWNMTDDHTPFLQRNIRAVDLIDFDYPSWHTPRDTADKVSADSLGARGTSGGDLVRKQVKRF